MPCTTIPSTTLLNLISDKLPFFFSFDGYQVTSLTEADIHVVQPISSAFRKYVRGVFETGCLALYEEKKITPILKPLVVPVIWLALIGAIYSRIASFFALNRSFFTNDEASLKTKQTIRFQGLFKVPITLQENEDKEYDVANFATFDYFRCMKFLYLHCGEETKLRDPRS